MPETRRIIFTNNATARLAQSIAEDDTVIHLAPDDVFNDFPNPVVGSQIFKITVENSATGEREIMNVTEVNGNDFTVERVAEQVSHIGGPPLAFPANSNVIVAHRLTAESLEILRDGGGSGGGLTLADHSDSYEVQLSDANTGIVNPLGNGANSYFIPGTSSIDFDRGTFFVFVNRDLFKTITVTIEEDTVRLAQDGTSTTSFAVGPGGMATVMKVSPAEDATEWFAIGTQIS